jgi:hypothetical protein
MYPGEPEATQHADETRWVNFDKFSRETWRNYGGDMIAGGYHGARIANTRGNPLGVLTTDLDTVTAADALTGNDLGLSTSDADCLGWALTHTGVADATTFFDGGDERDSQCSPSAARLATVGAETAITAAGAEGLPVNRRRRERGSPAGSL